MEQVRGNQAFFLTQLLDDEHGRDVHASSDGVCFGHQRTAVLSSLDRPGGEEIACLLLKDWRSRLQALSELLADHDRKRSYTNRHEPKGIEQGSWTEIIRRYARDDRLLRDSRLALFERRRQGDLKICSAWPVTSLFSLSSDEARSNCGPAADGLY
jgi:hypothetical protein